ncbi:MAG: hypothetical protein AAB597_01680 [Patescibacteria group bacterium]
MNGRFLFIGFVGVFLVTSIFFITGGREPAISSNPVEHVEILLTADGFKPNEVWIKKGGSATFRTDLTRPFWPASNLHPDHGIYRDFDPRRPLGPAESWSFTFDRVGDWGMHDHLRSYYVGTTHVLE